MKLINTLLLHFNLQKENTSDFYHFLEKIRIPRNRSPFLVCPSLFVVKYIKQLKRDQAHLEYLRDRSERT